MKEQSFQIILSQKEHIELLACLECQIAIVSQDLKLDQNLVKNAINYIHQKQSLGQYFLILNRTSQNQKQYITALMLVCFCCKQAWWIHSAYVTPALRRQGNFSIIFKYVSKIAKERGVKSLRLCVQQQNKRAKMAFQKLGMKLTDQAFYGFNFIYQKKYPNLQLENTIKYDIKQIDHQLQTSWPQFKSKNLQQQIFEGVIDNSQTSLESKGLVIYAQSKQILGYCQFFQVFQTWTCGFAILISVLYLNKNHAKLHSDLIKIFMKELIQKKQGLPAISVQFFIKQSKTKRIMQLVEGGQISDYNVMMISL